jgi:hypothetical protein
VFDGYQGLRVKMHPGMHVCFFSVCRLAPILLDLLSMLLVDLNKLNVHQQKNRAFQHCLGNLPPKPTSSDSKVLMMFRYTALNLKSITSNFSVNFSRENSIELQSETIDLILGSGFILF